MEKDKIQIETERLFIRVLRSNDVTEEYASGLNDSEVNKYMFVRHTRQTMESVKEFAEHSYESKDSILLGLFLKNEYKLIGTVRLSGISYYDDCLELGVCLFSKKHWGQGFGEEALMHIKNYVFSNMGFHYIEAGIYDVNDASKKLFEKVGFKCREEIEDKYRLEDMFVKVLIYKAVNHDFDLRERIKCDESIGSWRN